jgi:hypothetical protein
VQILRACLPATLLLACTGASPPLETARPGSKAEPGSTERARHTETRYFLPHLAHADARPWIDPEPFRVADLPEVTLPEPLQSKDAAGLELAAGQSAPELIIDRRDQFVWASAARVNLRIRDTPFAEIRVNGVQSFVECDRAALGTGAPAPLLPLRWSTLRAPPNADVEYAVTDAWFDVQRCDAAVVRRTLVRPKRLYGGFFFAFRERASARQPGVLTLLLPRAELITANGAGVHTTTEVGTFTRVRMPLVRGGGVSVILKLDTRTLDEWLRGGPDVNNLDARVIPHGTWGKSSILAGVEVSQGVSDPEAIGMAYMEVAPF